MANTAKEKFVGDLTEELKKSEHVVVTEYQGMAAEEFDALRAVLRPLGAKYKVVKNRLAKIAFANTGFSDLVSFLKGPSAITFQGKDGAAVTKILFKFGEDHQKFKVRAGRVLGLTADSKGLKALSSLPSREVLLATLLARMNAPLTTLVATLQEPLRGLHAALTAVSKKKETAA